MERSSFPGRFEDPSRSEDREGSWKKKLEFMEDALSAANALVEKLRVQLMEREEAEKQLRAELEIDHLTKLPNERGLLRHEERRRENRHPEHAVAMFIDINHFKNINDTLGHAAGDEIVKRVGEYLKGITRSESDTVVRLHGDEFFIVLEGMTEDEVMKKFAQKKLILDAAYGDGKSVEISLSVGITAYAPDEPLEAAMLRADEAMYLSKEKRDGSIFRFKSKDAESRPNAEGTL